jgi:enoyl-CoA hydratase
VGLRCIVLTGADPAFCAGDDEEQIMVEAESELSSSLPSEPRLTAVAGALLETDVPVIAAVTPLR